MKQVVAFVSGAVLATVVAIVVVSGSRTQLEPVSAPEQRQAPLTIPAAQPVLPAVPVNEPRPATKPARRYPPFRPPEQQVRIAKPDWKAPAPPAVKLVSTSTMPYARSPVFDAVTLPPAPEPNQVTLIAGTLLTVRLADEVSTEFNQPGDTFLATLDQPLIVDGFVIAERGARAVGRVLSVTESGRVKGKAELAVRLESLETSDGQTVELLTATFTRKANSARGRDAAKVGAAASIGALIGGIAGGGKGAAIGAAIGGGASAGAVLATKGKAARLESETRISFKLSEPVTIVERI